MKKKDILLLIGYLLIIISLLIFTYYKYTEKVNQCTSDPLKFAVEKIRYNYDVNYVYGSITISSNDTFKSWGFGDDIVPYEKFIVQKKFIVQSVN